MPTVLAPTGLRVVYLRDGTLWSWMTADAHTMLTDTGDLSALRLSKDGQWLAFLRGNEIWMIRLDGADARLLVTQENEGGALSFSPDGSLLALATTDHIDVIDLQNQVSATVLTYDAQPTGYYPEMVWSADSSGFKTVILSMAGTAQAEFLFVFPNGLKASLAKFEMVAPSESPALISPDGGYVIFVARLGDGRDSLFLMDSSGANKPYGDPAESIRVHSWLPDSKHFIYVQESENQALLGNVSGEPPVEINIPNYESVSWVEAESFLGIRNGNLYLGDLHGGETLVAEGVFDFDFVK